MDAKKAFEIAAENKKRISGDKCKPLYDEIIERIGRAARKGEFHIRFGFSIFDKSLFERVADQLTDQGYKCEVNIFHGIDVGSIKIRWGAEETEGEKHGD